jgi:hypothetical protein
LLLAITCNGKSVSETCQIPQRILELYSILDDADDDAETAHGCRAEECAAWYDGSIHLRL